MTARTYNALVDAHTAVARLNLFLACENPDYRPNEEIQAIFNKLHAMWLAEDFARHPEDWGTVDYIYEKNE